MIDTKPDTKRLFIFAAYAYNDAVIDDSKILYIRALSELGDVVFYMDNDTPPSELKKLTPYVLYAGANRHTEYDFGSYKRGFVWARENLDLEKYDWVYLVNDSMYAPLHPILPLLENLEHQQIDASGIVFNKNKKKPHLQSWFLGMRPLVFMSDQFDDLIMSVQPGMGKGKIISLYEHGFTRMLIEHGARFASVYTVSGHAVYNKIKYFFRRGFPFIKKQNFIRHHGALGGQIKYVLNRIDPKLRDAIIKNAQREFGEQCINNLLTYNPIKILWRNIKHILSKRMSR
ncbi:MAG: rhamnan synthesis F family protein [Rickettsiales bacterium]|jgi:lipopolysaccharide biosynthesis protein|nr:rhamnan synthesis F family protein [Rickettsiales bacterium]